MHIKILSWTKRTGSCQDIFPKVTGNSIFLPHSFPRMLRTLADACAMRDQLVLDLIEICDSTEGWKHHKNMEGVEIST